MRITACITTMNRTQQLDACLQALWNSHVKPYGVVVSDDSPDQEIQQQNYEVVQKYPSTTYILGPRRGVSANRNNAVNAVPESETDLVAFVDDDICVEPDFIGKAVEKYNQMPAQQRERTIISGVSRNLDGREGSPTKLSFRGYFCSSETPEAVNIHAALFPRVFFAQEQWDENIFIGYEDAELCLRALKRGYQILHCPELRVLNTGKEPTMSGSTEGQLLDGDIKVEAARLYVGVKRYKNLFPNPFKLVAFITVYFLHMTIYLWRRGSIQSLPAIIQSSRIQYL
ncbi:MAG: glycosyltransferase [Nostocaceae cyanobacterium]|nr:glycosyltransferase [Nostocaceae cyanobacterium]